MHLPCHCSPCHCQVLRRAARALTQHYDRALAPAGLTTPQFALLRTVDRLGPANISSAARQLGLDRTTLGRNLRPLMEAGLVGLDSEAPDGRERRVCVTPKGRAAVDRAMPLWEAVQEQVATQFGAEKLASLRGLLSELEAATR